MGATTFQMVMGKSPIVLMTWVANGQPLSDANEEVSMITQLDEERQYLWEMAHATFQNAQKWYKDFADNFWHKVNFERGDEVWLKFFKIRLQSKTIQI